MYGLLLKNLSDYVKEVYGEQMWNKVVASLKIENDDFIIDKVYPEGQLLKMSKKAIQVIGTSNEDFYEGMGAHFVELTGKLGYLKLISSLGRNLRNFFVNLDNLHHYLKSKYPRLKAPSFFLTSETERGMILQYRSKRRGFQYYVLGQIKAISKLIFSLDIDITLQKMEVIYDTVICTYDLKFVNSIFSFDQSMQVAQKEASLPVRASIIFEMFPFCILFQDNLNVTCIGTALRHFIPQVVGQKLSSYFELVKPLIELTFEAVHSHSNNTFELATLEDVRNINKDFDATSIPEFDDEMNMDEDLDKTFHIKGRMVFIQEWHQMLFIACPILKELESLTTVGLFINELSMHDYSRETLLAQSQQYIETRISLNSLEAKSKILNSQLTSLDAIKKKTDSLVYQMIPKSVATRLRNGEGSMNTCEAFECVTMLFSDIVGFTTICSSLRPPQVVKLLNDLYTVFDFLVDQNAVYKVETVGDAYFIVAGCPLRGSNHALKICDMAFDMVDGISILRDFSSGKNMEMRVGCHSGPVVAGVIGNKMPRYCLFGHNVGLTEKFESNSLPMKIHISENCRALLPPQYITVERKEEGLSQKVGGLKSYFLTSKENRKPIKKQTIKVLLPTDSETPKVDGEPNDLDSSNEELKEKPQLSIKDNEDNSTPSPADFPSIDTDSQYCGGFNHSTVCNLL
ncbi:soluble guanylate cyclase 88E isoform X2 [Lepeophtheirus salmonis]|uniref:soluble guanylate cyclase 88E isoform X2 n=1 Tax=Lepeophtheirus salmonis TaxID=72036 RepID=UPI001AE4FC20|nr:soluble guanylate cyclase 88E-like isoform X2 [Lepeophtheirus salmonis]